MIKGSVTAFKIIGDSITHEHGELCRKYINRDSVVFLKSVDEQEDLEEEFLDRFDGNYIDVELAKRTIAYLGGDKSGLGLMFKKTHNKDWVDFIIKFHNEDTFLVFQKYRELLDKNFEKKFHKLDI